VITPSHDGSVPEPVKLLLVDDKMENLEVLRHLLTSPGYELVMAQSGEEALRRALVEDFAAVVLDVLLPGMDGFEIATLIKNRERSRHTPILFLTASAADMRFIYRAYAVGGVDYMVKPIDPDVLRAKVAIFADLHRKDLRIQRQQEALREAERRERHRELTELRRTSEDRYRNLADAVPSIVWTADPTGALTYVNRQWTDYTGMDRDQTIGWNWLDAIHPDDVARFESGWRAAIARRGEYKAECRIRRNSDDAHRWHLCYGIPDVDREGRMVGWLATLTDTEDLRQAILARDDFLAVASHELRTPLSTLAFVIHGGRLIGEGESAVDREALLSKMAMAERQVNRLEKLVATLLDVTRITGRRLVLEPVDCDLTALVREVAARLRGEAERSGCALELRTPQPVRGRVDPLRVDQVLTNLITNAVRHGAGKPIDIDVLEENGIIRLSVTDRGEGIAPDDMPRLFGRFQRGTGGSAQSGLGLGLFISRHIAQAHGGDIHVKSEPGKGASFTVELPRRARPPGDA
jgi:PAS domain S-box-containing protein